MTTPELPPLDSEYHVTNEAGKIRIWYPAKSVEARERILIARIAELENPHIGDRWYAHGREVRDAKFSSRNGMNIVCVCEDPLHAEGIARALNIAGMRHSQTDPHIDTARGG